MSDCPFCNEPVEDDDDITRMAFGMVDDNDNASFEYRLAHHECAYRSVVGGIGHFENHELWCIKMHDPDGGRTYRQSAREVVAMMKARDDARFN